MPAKLNRELYYFCRLNKRPNMAKIRHCCAGKNCPHLRTKPRKNLAPNLVQITATQIANQSFS
jgi:hypothetical protein